MIDEGSANELPQKNNIAEGPAAARKRLRKHVQTTKPTTKRYSCNPANFIKCILLRPGTNEEILSENIILKNNQRAELKRK